MKKNFLLFLICLLATASGTYAQTTLANMTIKVTKAGTLADSIALIPSTVSSITTLTITGTINRNDIFSGLRTSNITSQKVTNLDLSACKIDSVTTVDVSGGLTFFPADELPDNTVNGSPYVTLKLPSTLKSIATGAFRAANNLTGLDFPESLVEIQSNALLILPKISTLTLPTGIKKVALNFPTLTSIVVPEGVTDLNLYNSGCTSGSFNVPSGVVNLNLQGIPLTTADNLLHEGMQNINLVRTGITSVTLPSTLKTLELSSDNIQSLTLPDRLKRLSMQGNTVITDLVLPASVDSVMLNSCLKLQSVNTSRLLRFANLTQTRLTSVTVPVGAKTFMLGGPLPYSPDTTLITITFSQGIDSIYGYNTATGLGMYVNNTSKLTSIQLPTNLVYIGDGAFESNTAIPSVDFIPSSVKSIGSNAFAECTGLTEVKLKEGLTDLGDYAFNNCTNVTKVTLPSTLESIGSYAFYTSAGITDVYSYAEVPPIAGADGKCFASTVMATTATLHVTSAAAKTAYSTEPVWKKFKNVVVDITAGIEDIRNNASLSLSGNPVQGNNAVLSFAQAADGAILRITDLAGKTLVQQVVATGSTTATLSVADLSKGIYLVNYSDNAGKRATLKIIK